MSTIRTEVCVLENVRPHPNADSLNLAEVKGWQMCLKKDERRTGDLVVYFEAGTVLPREWAEKFGVVNYLSEKTDINGDRVLVVGKVKLRGEASFGLTVPVSEALALMNEPETAVLFAGDDVGHLFSTSKYRPPAKAGVGDAEEDHPLFEAYTDIENLRNYPHIFVDGEEVEVTEKLHGTNCRIGFVVERAGEPSIQTRTREEYNINLIRMAGSREVRRKDPGKDNWESNLYWSPWAHRDVYALMRYLFTHYTDAEGKPTQSAILYGEVFGGNVQKGFGYGVKAPQFRAFCLKVNGKFLDRAEFKKVMDSNRVPTVPVLYRGPYSLAKIKELSEGKSEVGGGHMREGVVVRPVVERTHPSVGRVILKYVGDPFLFRKGGDEDDTTDQ